MGNKHIKQEKIIPIEKDYIEVKINGHKIIGISDNLNRKLGYIDNELIGCIVHDTLMTSIIKKCILLLLDDVDKENNLLNKFYKMKNFGNMLIKLRFVPVLKKNGKILWCNFSPYVYLKDFQIFAKVYVDIIEDNFNIAPNIPKEFLDCIDAKPGYFVKNYDDTIIIMMKIDNLYELALKKTSQEIALIHHTIIKILVNIIDYEFYPFLQMVEQADGSFMIIHNKNLFLPLDDIITETINFSLQATNKLNKYLNKLNTFINCGITIGDVCGGIIDGMTMRWFGSPINKSARLASKCDKNCLVIDDIFYDNLIQKNYNLVEIIQEEIQELKGLGEQKYYQIKLGTISKKTEPLLRKSISVILKSL